MKKTLDKILNGYATFRRKYAAGDNSLMEKLAEHGQKPELMVVACSDSRVDPAVLLQCSPGEIFTVRNVANIIPPYELDDRHHGTSAALEYGICYLKVKHLVILGHSQCGGINALINDEALKQDDFLTNWVSLLKTNSSSTNCDKQAKVALNHSYENALTFPWIQARLDAGDLMIHRWFVNIKEGKIYAYVPEQNNYVALIEGDIL